MRRHRVALVVGACFVVGANLSGMTVPWLTGRIVDLLQKTDAAGGSLDSATLLRLAASLVGLSLLAGLCRFFMRWLMIGASRRIEARLRSDFFAHLLLLEPDYFARRPLGDLMARATNDLNAVRMMLGPGLMYPLNIAATLAVALSFMIAIDLPLTLVGLAPLPILSALIYTISSRMHRGYTAIQERFSAITSRIQENLSGIRVIKAYVREDSEEARFRESADDYYHKNLYMVRLMGLFRPTFRLLSGMSVVLIFFFGSRAVMSGRISVGQLVAFIQYLIILSWPVMALGWVTGIIQRGLASWRRIREVLDRAPLILSPAASGESPAYNGDLEIRGLSFSYGGEPVLRDIRLELPAGSSLGIVGPTGSGKTTLLRLLPRLLDPPPGTVFLDGQDVREMPLSRLREAIAWVGQEPLLFSESLGDNLRFARPEAGEDQLRDAARQAAVLDEIETFPNAWETRIGERGINLSGGQQQRLCLARALLKDATLLVLDAPFSSVDTRTEELILQALRARLGRQTLLMVSHRISTVSLADRIVVLAEGRIAETGSHEELLELGGLYARMHEQQLLEAKLREEERSA